MPLPLSLGITTFTQQLALGAIKSVSAAAAAAAATAATAALASASACARRRVAHAHLGCAPPTCVRAPAHPLNAAAATACASLSPLCGWRSTCGLSRTSSPAKLGPARPPALLGPGDYGEKQCQLLRAQLATVARSQDFRVLAAAAAHQIARS